MTDPYSTAGTGTGISAGATTPSDRDYIASSIEDGGRSTAPKTSASTVAGVGDASFDGADYDPNDVDRAARRILAYVKGEHDLGLGLVRDPALRKLLTALLAKDPKERPSSSTLLSKAFFAIS